MNTQYLYFIGVDVIYMYMYFTLLYGLEINYSGGLKLRKNTIIKVVLILCFVASKYVTFYSTRSTILKF